MTKIAQKLPEIASLKMKDISLLPEGLPIAIPKTITGAIMEKRKVIAESIALRFRKMLIKDITNVTRIKK